MTATDEREPVAGHWTSIRQALGVSLAAGRQRVRFLDNQGTERTGIVVFWPGRTATLDSPMQPTANVNGNRYPIREILEVTWKRP